MPRLPARPPGMPDDVYVGITIAGSVARSSVLNLLSAGEMTASELADALALDVSTVSRHLHHLEAAGLVEADQPAGTRRGGTPTAVTWQAVPEAVQAAAASWGAFVTGSVITPP